MHCTLAPAAPQAAGTALPAVLTVSAPPETRPAGAVSEASAPSAATDLPWNVVVWDDPVNLMSYVTYVFRSYFGYPEEKARALMLEVHHRGRSVVASGSLEEAETHTAAMHGFGLWATFEKAGGE
jgi:ATP-dependent Clp protease adaptor protein ClpS